jgi:chromosome segregation ATPase
MQQMQQLASERTSLQAENSKLKQQLAEMTKDRDTLKSAQTASTSRVKASEAASAAALAQSNAQRESLEKDLKQTRDKMYDVVAKFREMAQQFHDTEVDRNTIRQTLATRDQEMKVCLDHNAALYKLNGEVLNRLDHQTVWSRVGASEPFTKIKRIELQNLVDDYQSRADDHRATADSVKAEAAAAAARAPAPPPGTDPTLPPNAVSNAPAPPSGVAAH